MFLSEIFVIRVRSYYFVSFNSKYISTREKAKFESWIKQKPLFLSQITEYSRSRFLPNRFSCTWNTSSLLFHNKVRKSKQQNTEIIDTGKKEITQFDEYHQFGYGISLIKVSRSRNMKQKIYEISTSPKIQTNSVIPNNCIDKVCLCFDRLLLLDLSAVQVLHT